MDKLASRARAGGRPERGQRLDGWAEAHPRLAAGARGALVTLQRLTLSLWWVLANVLGAAVAGAALSSLSILEPLVLGVFFGVPQGLVLRRSVPGAGWGVAATFLGFFVGVTDGLLVVVLLCVVANASRPLLAGRVPLTGPLRPLDLGIVAVGGVCAGVLIGAIQILTLDRRSTTKSRPQMLSARRSDLLLHVVPIPTASNGKQR